jgi:NADH-quinone oxidoreductase subunit L
MFFAAGVSAYPAAMFHLTTHAFFKALLFLGAGSVIHALSDEQDLRNMGGIWRKIPITYSLMWIGSLALAGFPFFAGYYSKDMILEAAWASDSFTGQMAFWLGCAAALLTAFYSWRLLIMAFHGKPRCSAEVFEHVHESPPIMILPLIPLAFGAIFAGWFGYQSFVGYDMSYFWGDSLFILPEHHAMEEAHHVAEWVKRLPVILAASGVGLAIIAYLIIPSLPARVVSMARPIHTLFFNKWFFDELYDLLFVRASVRFGRFLWVKGDKQTIDAFGPDGLSGLVLNGSNKLSKLQSGYVYHYAFAMMIGVVMLLSWYFSGFGR